MSLVELEPELEPVAVDVTVGIGALLAALVLFGIKFSFDATFGFLLRHLGDVVGHVPVAGGALKSVFHDTAAFVDSNLGDAATAAEGVAVRFFLGLWHLVKADAETLAWLAESIADRFEHFAAVTVPNVARESVDGWRRWFEAAIGPVEHAAHKALHGIDELEHRLEHELRGVEAAVAGDVRALEHGIDVTLPHAIGHAVGDIRHYVDEHLGALERLIEHRYRESLAAASAGAVVAVILRTFPFLGCRNVRSLARKLCGLPTAILEGLLAGELAVLLLEETCRIAEGVEFAASHSLPALEKWLLLEPFVCLGGGAKYPSGYVAPVPLKHATAASAL